MKLHIGLIDTNFQHQQYISPYFSSSKLQFCRDRSQFSNKPFVVITDACLFSMGNIDASLKKIAWLLEPRSISPAGYEWIQTHYHAFYKVWTHDGEILKTVPNAVFVPTGGTWLRPQDIQEPTQIHKTEDCSLILSAKNITRGQKLRHLVCAMVPEWVETFGYGTPKPLAFKASALTSFRFSIVIENDQIDTYFSEKLIDCFLTCTIPIYWGTSRIAEYFNVDGFMLFQDLKMLAQILLNLNAEQEYAKRQVAIADNFHRSKAYIFPEEWGLLEPG